MTIAFVAERSLVNANARHPLVAEALARSDPAPDTKAIAGETLFAQRRAGAWDSERHVRKTEAGPE